MSEATKRPWRVGEGAEINDAHGERIASAFTLFNEEEEDRAIAEFIVAAVNAYDSERDRAVREAMGHALDTRHVIGTCSCLRCEDVRHTFRAAVSDAVEVKANEDD